MTVKIDRAYPLSDHRIGLKENSYQGVINVGDKIYTDNGRVGEVKTITISIAEHDIAGETYGVNVPHYDTKLEYQGNVLFGDNYWTYFNQIVGVVYNELH